jgi:hypothetical protein
MRPTASLTATRPMYDTLLLLHLLGAFTAFVTIAMFSAYALGVTPDRGGFLLADWAWNVSGLLLVVFGVWLALDVDGYEIWDGWILASLVLLGVAAAFGSRARIVVMNGLETGDGPAPGRLSTWHWLRTAAVVAILVLMIWKPGA